MRTRKTFAAFSFAVVVFAPGLAAADESGVSFWVLGFFGSLAATPEQPGWSVANIYYHDSDSAGGNVALANAAQIGQIAVNLTATVNANVSTNVDIDFLAATYAFATPVLGGQAAFGILGAYGANSMQRYLNLRSYWEFAAENRPSGWNTW